MNTEEVICAVLEGLISVRRYMAVNCRQPDIDSNRLPSQLFGYWIPPYSDDQLSMDSSFIEHYLRIIGCVVKSMASSVSVPDSCIASQTLLKNFIKKCVYRPYSLNIQNSKIYVIGNGSEPNRYTTLGEMHKRIEVSYDVELMYWYQHFVVSAIMKHLFIEVAAALNRDGALIEKTAVLVQKETVHMSKDEFNVPARIIEGFKILTATNEIRNSTDEFIHRFNDYQQSLSDVELVYDNYSGETSYDSAKDELDVQKRVYKFIQLILQHLDDFKCFQRHFKVVSHEHERYYMPFMGDKQILVSNTGDTGDDTGVCDFVRNIYSAVYQILKFLKGNDSITDESDLLNSDIWDIVSSIKDYFIAVIESNTKDVDMLRMAYNIAIILVKVKARSNYIVRFFKISRILSLIMAELDGYFMKHCTSYDTKLLLINNAIFFDIFDKEFIKEFAIEYFHHIVPNFETKFDSRYNYLDVYHLYFTFVSDAPVFELYGNRVKFYWERNVQNVKTFLKFLAENIVINPYWLFAFYDIYLKFYIAVFYFEMWQVMQNTNLDNIKAGFKTLKLCLRVIDYDHFPSELRPLINDINQLYVLSIGKLSDDYLSVMTKMKTNIDQQFRKFNFIFTEKPTSQRSRRNIFLFGNDFIYLPSSEEKLRLLNNDFIVHVKNFNNHVLNLKWRNNSL